jgi:hypothetical protein
VLFQPVLQAVRKNSALFHKANIRQNATKISRDISVVSKRLI